MSGAARALLATMVATVALFLSGCLMTSADLSPLAKFRVAADFDSYAIRRVGLVPFAGTDLTAEDARELGDLFYTELSRSSRLEIVPLSLSDLEEIPGSDPFRAGWIRPRTVIDVSRRFRLDGILIGTVTERAPFAPQRFGAQLELVAAETGVPVWTSTVYVDASDERVRAGVERWFQTTRATQKSGETWDLALLSPRRFTQYAAYEVARGLR